MNFFNRFQGVFLSPQQTFKGLAEKPVWVDALVILLIATALFTYIVTPYALQDRLHMEENNIKLKERVGEEQFNKRLEFLRNPPSYITIIGVTSALAATAIGLLFSSLIILLLGRLSSTEGKYVQILSAFVYANIVDKVLGNALRLFLILNKKSAVQTTTSLALFFPNLEVTSPAFIVLVQVDFFQLWLFGILGYGLSSLFKIELKKALVISYGFWLLKSLLNIAIALIGMRMYGG